MMKMLWIRAVFACAAAVGVAGANSQSEQSDDNGALGGPSSGASPTNPSALLDNSGSMVNEFTGTAAYTFPLGAIAANNGLNFPLTLSYSGGSENVEKTNNQFIPSSWVGLGFTLKWPQIIADNKGTSSLADDDYSLSLDGQPVKLVASASDPNKFFLKNNRAVSVTRVVGSLAGQTATDPYGVNLGATSYGGPNPVISYSVPFISNWTVTMPDGATMAFDYSGNCDADFGVLCTPAIQNSLGYQPFYNLSTGAKIPEQWNVSHMLDREKKFSLSFQYTKDQEIVSGVAYVGAPSGIVSPTMKADRAVYLAKIEARNGGIASDAKVMSEVILTKTSKPAMDYYSYTGDDPLRRFERYCLGTVQFKTNGKTVQQLNLSYDQTSNGRLLLFQIDAVEPAYGKMKTQVRFNYGNPETWRLASAVDKRGVETIFEYEGVGIFSRTMLDVSQYVGTITNGKVGLRMEYGNNLFVSLDATSGCGDATSDNQDKLFQFTNRGTFWELTRVFKAPFKNCTGKFTMGPDASYFTYGGRVYNRPLEENYSVIPKVVDLNVNPSYMPYKSISGISAYDNEVVFAFKDWFVMQSGSGSPNLSFGYRGNGGAWRSGNEDPNGNTSSGYCIVPVNTDVGIPETRSGCILLSSGTVEIRQGNGFLAVLHKMGDTGPNVLRVYGYETNQIKEYTAGLKRSAREKGVDLRSGLTTTLMTGNKDYWSDWSYNVFDWSVSGNIIMLSAKKEYGDIQSIPPGIFIFGWDGYQLRFISEITGSTIKDVFYAGPDYFIHKAYDSYTNNYGSLKYRKVDLATWSLMPEVAVPISLGSETPYWTVKAMKGYFFLEKMTDPSKTFEPAIMPADGTEGAYPSLKQNALFYIYGSNGGAIAQVGNLSPWPGYILGNLNMAGDKMMGLKISTTTGMASGYTFSRLLPGSQDSPQWSTMAFPGAISTPYFNAIPISTGAATFSHGWNGAKHYFSGIIEFRTSTPWHGIGSSFTKEVVKSITTKTRGAASSGVDGTQNVIKFDYSGSSPYFNTISQNPIFPKVTKSAEVNGASPIKTTTEFLVDALGTDGSQLLPYPKRILSGFPKSIIRTTTPTSISTSIAYRADVFATAPDGSGLKESVLQPVQWERTTRNIHGSAHMEERERRSQIDPFNGSPKVTVTKKGSDFIVALNRFAHELPGWGGGVPYTLKAQTATYLFPNSDPCASGTPEDPCSNIDAAWLGSASQQTKAVGSQVTKYSLANYPSETWSWRPGTLGTTPLVTLDGSTPASGWELENSIPERSRDIPASAVKDAAPTISSTRGVTTVHFNGGALGYPMGQVANADKSTCSLLSGEEGSVTPGRLGAFGEWLAGNGALSQEVVHTGSWSIKTTAGYGPSVDIKYWTDGDTYWKKARGFSVSAWIYAKGTNDNSSNDPLPSVSIQLKDASGAVIKEFDLVAEYGPKGSLPYNRWVKLQRLISFTELKAWIPNLGSYLTLRIGKGTSANSNPVYADDIRLLPANASAEYINYDGIGRISSTLDGNNNPVFLQYDVWGGRIGAKDARGIGYQAVGLKMFNE